MNNPTELTNMVMIENPATNEVLVQHRRLYRTGISFPGGHVEDGESITASAVREVREETGLSVKNLRLSGVMHWFTPETGARYLVFLYRTTDFSGELLSATRDGEVFWVKKDDLPHMALAPDFDVFLRVFLQEEKSEAFSCCDPDGNSPFLIQ